MESFKIYSCESQPNGTCISYNDVSDTTAEFVLFTDLFVGLFIIDRS